MAGSPKTDFTASIRLKGANLNRSRHAFVCCCLVIGLAVGSVAQTPIFEDVSDAHLPVNDLVELTMDAMPADIDGDGDLDIILAMEHKPNILLVNDGTGRFTNESAVRIPQIPHDSEDVGVGDLDRDGDLDIVVVSEDDQVNELYLNRGNGTFEDASHLWPVTGISNALLVIDIEGDGDLDLLVGNNGQNFLLRNSGSGSFSDSTRNALPAFEDVTQDLEAGDVDGDGDLDLYVGNEGQDRLLINIGGARFVDETESRLPALTQVETREADFGDVDGDGDLDIILAATRFFMPTADRQNRLLINDGMGRFTDETQTRMPRDWDLTVDCDFVDLDGDGDLDVLVSNTASETTTTFAVRWIAYRNDGTGHFENARWMLPFTLKGKGFDAEAADFNGDGRIDLYLCSRAGADRLALGLPIEETP